MRTLKPAIAFIALALSAGTVQAQTLQDVMSAALRADPLLDQAQANLSSAKASKKAAFAGHYPQLGVQGTNRLTGDIDEVDPELVASVNVWAGGGIQAQYRSAGYETLFYEDKLAETRENLAYEIARLYLDGLRIEAQLEVSERSLARHRKIVDDLGIVVKHDVGRQYDLIQAQARMGQVETQIITLEASRDAAQARLSRYTRGARTQLEPLLLSTAPADDVTLTDHPSYLAQQEDLRRAGAQVDVAKAQLWPRVNLESVATEKGATRLAFDWSVLNFGRGDNIRAARERKAASAALLDAVKLELNVRREAARVNYERSQQRLKSARKLIDSSRQVTEAFKKQFQIARRSMVDLLNAYSELANVEATTATAEYDRLAFGLEYLHACARTEAGVRASAPMTLPLFEPETPADAIDLSKLPPGAAVNDRNSGLPAPLPNALTQPGPAP